MELYLDLNKAQQSSSGRSSQSESQSTRAHSTSYNTSNAGVGGGTASYDDPDVGKKWKHDGSDDDEKKKEREDAEAKAQDENLIPTAEETGSVEKGFGISALDMVKSITGGIRETLGLNMLSKSEVDFLHLVKGYSLQDINLGSITIGGKDRAQFSAFLQEKARLATANLYRR